VNVEVIAEALADNYPDKDFLFVGHADVRGATSYNMALSIGRAQAVQAEVIRLRPSLTDKISIVGKGESTPLSKGNTEADHSVNRRLEIVIR
jgi:outer membrane protein OmpA-like peptidoglycan-associated protein